MTFSDSVLKRAQEPTRPPKVGSRTAREPPLEITFGVILAQNYQNLAMMLNCCYLFAVLKQNAQNMQTPV